MGDTVNVAAIQQPPAVLDLDTGVECACMHIAEAASHGAQLVVFPEAWLTGYPAWVFGMAGWGDPVAKRWYAALVKESPTVPDPRIAPILEEAARQQVAVVLGLTERARPESGTLFNSQLLVGADGNVVGVHRKLTPTHTERLVWAPGDASGLQVHATPAGRVGGLTCWEHWHPLARHALHVQDEQIHIAAWPDMPEIHHVASRSYAFEGRCFVVCAGQYLAASDVPDQLRQAYRYGVAPGSTSELLFTGDSGVIGPDGTWIAGPLSGEPGIIHARIDLSQSMAEKHDIDVAGHYDRPDVFQLTVTRQPSQTVRFRETDNVDQTPASDSSRNDFSEGLPGSGV